MGEKPIPTAHPKILQTLSPSLPSVERLQEGVARMLAAARDGDEDGLNAEIQRLVPSFRPAAELISSGEPAPPMRGAEMAPEPAKPTLGSASQPTG